LWCGDNGFCKSNEFREIITGMDIDQRQRFFNVFTEAQPPELSRLQF